MRNPMRNTNIPKNKKKFKHNLYKPKVNDILRVIRQETAKSDKYDEIVFVKSFYNGVPLLIIVDIDAAYSNSQPFNINGANYYQKDSPVLFEENFKWKFEFIANLGKIPRTEIYDMSCDIAPEFFI